MNPCHLITKYRIRSCNCREYRRPCGRWFVDDMSGNTGIYGDFPSWSAAFDAVLRSQTQQYYRLSGGHS